MAVTSNVSRISASIELKNCTRQTRGKTVARIRREFFVKGKSIKEIDDLLTFAGVEVEGIVPKGVSSEKIVVAQIKEAVDASMAAPQAYRRLSSFVELLRGGHEQGHGSLLSLGLHITELVGGRPDQLTGVFCIANRDIQQPDFFRQHRRLP